MRRLDRFSSVQQPLSSGRTPTSLAAKSVLPLRLAMSFACLGTWALAQSYIPECPQAHSVLSPSLLSTTATTPNACIQYHDYTLERPDVDLFPTCLRSLHTRKVRVPSTWLLTLSFAISDPGLRSDENIFVDEGDQPIHNGLDSHWVVVIIVLVGEWRQFVTLDLPADDILKSSS